MKIHRYERCFILTFLTFGKWQLELVYAPKNYRIREHSHDQQSIKLIPIFCHNIRFWRRKRNDVLSTSFQATFRHIGRVFTINAGDYHYFECSNWPLVFINVEKWNTKPTSAAVDLQLTENKKEGISYAATTT